MFIAIKHLDCYSRNTYIHYLSGGSINNLCFADVMFVTDNVSIFADEFSFFIVFFSMCIIPHPSYLSFSVGILFWPDHFLYIFFHFLLLLNWPCLCPLIQIMAHPIRVINLKYYVTMWQYLHLTVSALIQIPTYNFRSGILATLPARYPPIK